MPAPGGGEPGPEGAWWRPPPATATAVGSTHPTGMYSCCYLNMVPLKMILLCASPTGESPNDLLQLNLVCAR